MNSSVTLNLDQITAVSWDFDGTLANTYSAHHEARFRAFKDCGYGDIPAELHAFGPRFGTNTVSIIGGILQAAGKIPKDTDVTQDERVHRVVAAKRTEYLNIAHHGLDAQPGAVELVKKLANRYVGKMAIVTTAMRDEVIPFLDRYGLHDYFPEHLLITEETVLSQQLNLKPAPDAYILAADRMNIHNAKKQLVFEDSTGGAEAARLAGATLLVVSASQPEKLFAPQEPEYFVKSLTDINVN